MFAVRQLNNKTNNSNYFCSIQEATRTKKTREYMRQNTCSVCFLVEEEGLHFAADQFFCFGEETI